MSDPHPKPTPKPVPKPVPKQTRPVPTQPVKTAGLGAANKQTGPVSMPHQVGYPTQQIQMQHPGGNSSTWIRFGVIIASIALAAALLGYLIIQNRIKLREQLAKNAAIEKKEQEAKLRAMGVDPASLAPTPDPKSPKPANPPVSSSDIPVVMAGEVNKVWELGKGARIRLRETVHTVKVWEEPKGVSVTFIFDVKGNMYGAIQAFAWESDIGSKLSKEMFEPYVARKSSLKAKSRLRMPKVKNSG